MVLERIREFMIIRQGTANDINKVSRLWLKMVRELSPNGNPNVEWWRDIAVSCLKSGMYEMVVAEDGGKIVGFGDFFISPEPLTGKIHWMGRHLFVDVERRETSLAGKIYRKGIEIGKEKGATVFDVFCAPNEIPLWSKKGYVENQLVMRKH
mgnify:FL=1